MQMDRMFIKQEWYTHPNFVYEHILTNRKHKSTKRKMERPTPMHREEAWKMYTLLCCCLWWSFHMKKPNR